MVPKYRSKFTASEDKQLKEFYGYFTMKEISERMNRSISSIAFRLRSLDVAKKIKYWTDDEVSQLLSLHRVKPNREIAAILNRSLSAIDNKIAALIKAGEIKQ